MTISRNDEQLLNTSSHAARYSWRQPKERGVPACLSYMVEGNRIRLSGNAAGVQFNFPIGDVVEAEEVIVICLRVPEGRECRENVYAIDRAGNFLWRVKLQTLDSRNGHYVASSSQGALVRLYGGDCRAYDLDPRTGSVIEAAALPVGNASNVVE